MPGAKKDRSKQKKQALKATAEAAAAAAATAPVATAAAPKRSPFAAVHAAAARLKAANAATELSKGLEAFLSIDLPADKRVACEGNVSDAPPDTAKATPDPVLLEVRASNTLAQGDAQTMYDLLKGNMHEMYEEAGWGWDEKEKWGEMEHRDARFLIARGDSDDGEDKTVRSSSGEDELSSKEGEEKDDGDIVNATGGGCLGEEVEKAGDVGAGEGAGGSATASALPTRGVEAGRGEGPLAGYCHFRFAWDMDDNEDGEGAGGTEDVLYVYELQVAPWAKRRGLGRRMMQALELLANRHGMSKVMLTVFKENKQAMSFYTKKMNYVVDKDSPSNWDQPNEVYEILSKPTRQGAARAREAELKAALLD